MASSSYRAELTCSVCRSIFTDPVSLSCGHSFCRECVTKCPEQTTCPCCQVVFATDLITNLNLKKLADTVKEDIKNKGSSWMCAEHEEKLKLFCETDQQLVCVICRDGEKHDRHKFKPIKEAAQIRRQIIKDKIQLLIGQNITTEDLIKTQESEKTKLKEKWQQLKMQISCQFNEMQQFLKRRQKEIQEELEQKSTQALQEMEANLETLKTHLSDARARENWMRSQEDVSEPEAFLKGWAEKMREQPSKAAEMKLVCESLTFSPYSSHLQVFIWKEMLQVIKPLPNRLRMEPGNTNMTVSLDGRSMYSSTEITQNQHDLYTIDRSRNISGSRRTYVMANTTNTGFLGGGFSLGSPLPTQTSSQRFSSGQPDYAVSDQFSGGQHYWEVEVGLGAVWKVGVKCNNLITALQYDGKQYFIQKGNANASLLTPVTDEPRKIGVYLNSETNELLFYNADNSKLIHTVIVDVRNAAPYCAVGYDKESPNPLKICWY